MSIDNLVEKIVKSRVDRVVANLDLQDIVKTALSENANVEDEIIDQISEIVSDTDVSKAIKDSDLEDKVIEILEEEIEDLTTTCLNNIDIEKIVEGAIEDSLEKLAENG